MIGKILVTVVVLAAVGAGGWFAYTSVRAEKIATYQIEFDNAFGLTEGGDLRVGGVRAGSTDTFDLTASEPQKALVTATITEKGFDSFRKDASCDIRQQSLIGEYYVDCQPGRSAEKLPTDGTGRVPVAQTSSTIPADLVNNVLRRPYRERLRLIIAELGTGLAGRPKDLQETLRRAHPGLRETSKTLRLLSEQNEVIKDFIKDSDTVMVELEKKKKHVSRWVKEAGETAEISASRRRALQAGFNKLPGFLAELEPTMAELGRFTDEQTPLLRDLQAAAPELDRFFTELGPFSEASRPAFRSLGELGDTATPVLHKSRDEIRQLARLAEPLPERSLTDPGLAKPLRQFFESLDTRSRSVERDKRAKSSAPPRPDKTAYTSNKQGFTGFEAVWNYFYWQTLSINAFDEISHFLRVLGVEDEHCGQYSANPDPHTQEDCGSYLGPYQPGLQGNAPDPTSDHGSARSRRSGRGRPEEQAKDGENDLSKPQPKLPPELQEMLDATRKRDQPSGAPGGGSPADEQLLEYLLAP